MDSWAVLPTLAWIIVGALVLLAVLTQVAAWRLRHRPSLSRLLRDLGISMLSGSILTTGFLAVTVSMDANRADRERSLAEVSSMRQLIGTVDRLPGLRFHLVIPDLYARNKDLSGADLSFSFLDGADFTGTSLADADLHYTHLRGAVFRGADLTGASLENAWMDFADLRGALLAGANLSGVDFKGGLAGPVLCYDTTTSWPSGYVPPTSLEEAVRMCALGDS